MTMPNKPNARGFSLVDLLVVIVVIAAMLAVQIPTDAAARRTARRMQNSTQLRGIHQGLVVYSNANKEYFPGLNSRGDILTNGDKTTGSSGPGDYVQARYWVLLDGDFFTPDYAISPSETADITTYDHGFKDVSAKVLWDNKVKHYSYAMLDIHSDKNKPTQVSQDAMGRKAEWSASLNSQAIVLSDRNAGTDAGRKVQSIHSDDPGEWIGSVLWNDNHVGFETDHDSFVTQYGNGELNADEFNDGKDNLFSNEKNGKAGKLGYDALMLTADNDIVHAGE